MTQIEETILVQQVRDIVGEIPTKQIGELMMLFNYEENLEQIESLQQELKEKREEIHLLNGKVETLKQDIVELKEEIEGLNTEIEDLR